MSAFQEVSSSRDFLLFTVSVDLVGSEGGEIHPRGCYLP